MYIDPSGLKGLIIKEGLIVPPVITIQPLVPERLPCYDFRPVVYYPWMSLDNFRYSLLPARDRQLVDLEALISP